eukprot:c6785_g1_i1.p1 GENE.c6785_g1_i1~~c6785_g1_i1.p1  ORF type:complete len:219 (+),score=21.94 c6785_g1_i1:25-681(+)
MRGAVLRSARPVLFRGFATAAPEKPRIVAAHVTHMSLFPGKWGDFALQSPQISREVATFPDVCKGPFYAVLNLGTRPGLHTSALSVSLFNTLDGATQALEVKPKTRALLQPLMLHEPRRTVSVGVAFSFGRAPTDPDCCFVVSQVNAKPGSTPVHPSPRTCLISSQCAGLDKALAQREPEFWIGLCVDGRPLAAQPGHRRLHHSCRVSNIRCCQCGQG